MSDNVVDFQMERLKRSPVAFCEEVLNVKIPLWQRQAFHAMMRKHALYLGLITRHLEGTDEP